MSIYNHYDIVFVGWGASTCILIIEMEKQSLLKGKNILIIDPNDKKENDKTFCFWSKKEDEIYQNFKTIVSKSWSSIQINDNKSFLIDPLEYFHIDCSDLYNWSRKIVSEYNISHIKEAVLKVYENKISDIIRIVKKNLKNLLLLSLIISLLILLISLNQQKKFLSKAIIVIEPEDSKIVNIEEAYSVETRGNRINNQMAILKSDEVLEYIIKDKKNSMQFKNLYSQSEQNFLQRILSKEKIIDDGFLKANLTNNFNVKNVPRSDVLELSFVSENPKISQLALLSIIDSYQRYEIDSKIKITTYANQKITERLKELVVQMDIAQKKLSNYKKENNLVDTGNVKELKIKEIQSISDKIIEAKQKYQQQHKNTQQQHQQYQ